MTNTLAKVYDSDMSSLQSFVVSFLPTPANEWLIIIFSLSALFIYYRVKLFKSFLGIFLLSLFIFLMIFRLLTAREGFTDPFLVNFEALQVLVTLLFTLVAVLLIFVLSGYRKQPSRKVSYLFKIFLLYLVFAIIEQLFFNFVVAQTIYYLIQNLGASVFLAGVFFSLFHVQLKKRDRAFFITGSFVMGMFNSWLYLSSGSIILASLSMAIIAGTYYSFLCEVDVLKFRFGD